MNKCNIVANKEGKHMIVMPDGKHIPAVVWTRVWDGLPNEASYVIARPNQTSKK